MENGASAYRASLVRRFNWTVDSTASMPIGDHQARAETVAFLRSIPGMAAGGVRKAAGAFFGLIFGGAVSSEAASFFWRLACASEPSLGTPWNSSARRP